MAFYQQSFLFLLTILILTLTRSSCSPCPYNASVQTIALSSKNISMVEPTTFKIHYNCTYFTILALTINLSFNDIRHINQDSFKTFYNIKHLDLSHNQISCLDNYTFTALTNLETLNLGYNNFTELKPGPYNLVALKSLNFEHNNINYVWPGVVNDSNIFLEDFNLQYNSLTTFEPWPCLVAWTKRDRFDRIFDLRHNLINTFTNDMNWKFDLKPPYEIRVLLQFNNVSTLTASHIQQYFPHTLNEGFLTAFLSFHINVTNNPYFCDCNLYTYASKIREGILRWSRVDQYRYVCGSPSEYAGIDWLHDIPLQDLICNRTVNCPINCSCQDRPHNDTLHIDCRGVGLKKFPSVIPDTNRSKIELFLDDNFIDYIVNATFLPSIYNLSISNNGLTEINEDLLKEMKTLSKLDVRNNKIRTIPAYLQIFHYEDTKISGNPLFCDCNSMWLSDWVRQSKEDVSLTCDSVKGTHALKTLNPQILGCTHIEFIILGISIGIVLLFVLLIGLFVYRCPFETKVILQRIFSIHPWDKYKVDEEETKDVDIYLVFDSDPDVIGWVRQLLKRLGEKKPFYKILNPYRFMEPGSQEESIRKWIGRSKRVLVILSMGIFRNRWRNFEIDVAEDNSIKALTNKRPVVLGFGEADLENQIEGYDDVEVSAKIIYIIYDRNVRKRLQNEPWVTRLLGKTVLMPVERLFMSKLRYELPRYGLGNMHDQNFQLLPVNRLKDRFREEMKIKRNKSAQGEDVSDEQ